MNKNDRSSGSIAFKTRQSLIWYTTVPFIIHFLRFANSILLARLLSPSDFGIIGIITVIFYYCDSFSDFGFGKAIIQRKEITGDHYASYFSFNILVSLLFFFSIYFFSESISSFYGMPELSEAMEVLAFMFLITAVSAGARVKLKRSLDFKSIAIIDGLKVALQIAISLTLALNDFGFWSIIVAVLISNFFALILLLLIAQYAPKFSFNLKPLKDLYHFGLWDFLGAQFKLISDSADKLIIGKVLGASSLGFYDKAAAIAIMPSDQISLRLSHISFSSFSRIQDDPEELDRYFFKIVILNSVILLPILAGLCWVSGTFTLVLLGEKWLPMVSSLQIFSVSFIFASFSNPVIAMNQAIAQVKAQTLIRIVLTIVLVIGLMRVSLYGIESAALAVLVFNILMFILSYSLLNRFLKFGWAKLLLNLLPPVTLVVIMLLSLCALDYFFSLEENFLNLLLEVLVGGISYTAAFLFLPFDRLDFLRDRVLKKFGLPPTSQEV